MTKNDTAFSSVKVSNMKEQVNGKQLYYAMASGAQKLWQRQAHINKINVFPVPDGDTGSNLAATLRAALLSIQPNPSYHHTLSSMAQKSLVGARGNSGIIVAQYLNGLLLESKVSPLGSLEDFTHAAKAAVHHMYKAVFDPRDGTLLSVIKDWAEHIHQHQSRYNSFLQMFRHGLVIAKASLAQTTAKIKELEKAKVVDAGAMGFVVFLEGVLDFVKNHNVRQIKRNIIQVADSLSMENHVHDIFDQRYCTEALIIPNQFQDFVDMNEKLHILLKRFGNSIVMAGNAQTLRIHIHTDKPAELFYALRDYGKINQQKAEDMHMQYQSAHKRKSNIALVTDSCCDLPQDFVDERQIHVVPINLYFGDNHYLDKLTITPQYFYDLLDECDVYPTTAQPNVQTFVALYSHLLSYHDSVIAVHLSAKLSGTFHSSRKAAEQVSREFGKPISVLDSRGLSGSQALLVKKTAEAIADKVSHKQIVNDFKHWQQQVKIFVSVPSLQNMVRGGRVSPIKGKIARLLNLKPIISIDSKGQSQLLDKGFSEKMVRNRIIKRIKNHLRNHKISDYIVLHASAPEKAHWFCYQMQKLCSLEPFAIQDISPVIGLNSGKGAAAIAFWLK